MATFQVIDDKPDFAINNEGNSERSNIALWVANKLQNAALQSGNPSTTGIHNHLDGHSQAECLGSVLELMKHVESACHLPLLCAGTATSRTQEDEFMMNPLNYAKSMVMLARDMDAQPWGAFAFHAPSVYLLFLQQLATDLMA